MKKCAKCGGSMYKTGGSTMKTKLDVPKGKIYGIPQTGGTGPITMKKGGSAFGMLSVKAGVDKNPKATAADRIAGAKMSKKKMGGATKKKC